MSDQLAANGDKDADMSECDGQNVVTMMDVLQEQQDFEEDANAVLGASDDQNCTYPKGYVKRQALYACLTCCPEARTDETKRAGVCLACSLHCHENHELIELYTKRNFRCDCGNPKFGSNKCTFTPEKTELNYDNRYNQNFSGVYCVCHRPYPDPEATAEEEMIQCVICEDWLHENHLEATVPNNDQYAEMVCKACMEDYDFLHDYSDLVINVVDKEIIVTDPDLDFNIHDSELNGSLKKDITNGETKEVEDKTEEPEKVKETEQENEAKPEGESNNKIDDAEAADINKIEETVSEQEKSTDPENKSAENIDNVSGGNAETEGDKENLNESQTNEGEDSKVDNTDNSKSTEETNSTEKNESNITATENNSDINNENCTESSVSKSENNSTDANFDDEITKECTSKLENNSTDAILDGEVLKETPDNKRKHETEDGENLVTKKAKLDDKPCVRPRGVKRLYKGATFWPSTLRQKLCTCGECISMYKDLGCLYLIDLEDTVTAYEALGKEIAEGPSSQYEKGLQALSSLDRVQQINALTEYNKMRDKLLDFLKSFKDRREIVKEEDIKAFFAGMKPKREPDGVYFCR